MHYYTRFLLLLSCTTGYLSAASSAAGWSWQDCGLPTDGLRPLSIEISPDPPVPGQELNIKAEIEAQEVVDDGATANVQVKLGLIKLLSKTVDICEEARKANATVQCPIERGVHLLDYTTSLPKAIPKAKFTINLVGYSATEEDLFCTNFVVDFRP